MECRLQVQFQIKPETFPRISLIKREKNDFAKLEGDATFTVFLKFATFVCIYMYVCTCVCVCVCITCLRKGNYCKQPEIVALHIIAKQNIYL